MKFERTLLFASCCLLVAAELPLFAPTYNMQQSTLAMVCNYTGMTNMSGDIGRFGIIDYDWNNGKGDWVITHPMTAEEQLVQQAIQRKHVMCPEACPLPDGCPTKDACPQAKTWVYRNTVKALPWFTSVREKLDDPQYSGWFLKFNPKNHTYNVPQCDDNYSPAKCSDFYHDQGHTPGFPTAPVSYGICEAPCDCGDGPCGEYLFDHRNASLTKWLVEDYIAGASTGLANPNIDGFFLDDRWGKGGPTEIVRSSIQDMGLSPSEVDDIMVGWQNNMKQINAKILNSNAFNWQMFDENSGTAASAPFKKEECTDYMRSTACKTDSKLQHRSLFYGFTDFAKNKSVLPYFEQDLAAFLLIRGPYAWLGYSWQGCFGDLSASKTPIQYHFPDALDLDYGEPTGVCEETAEGSEVFVRQWSKANVTLDCKNWQGKVTMLA